MVRRPSGHGLRLLAVLLGVAGAAGLAGCAGAPVATGGVGPPWTDETFLPNYSELKPIPTRDGQDYVWTAPDLESRLATYRNGIVVDQPEVFVSPRSPYTGAKPADLESIAEFVRARFDAQLTARGYRIVDSKGPGTVYVRLAITNLQFESRSRNLLEYTPIGFVVGSVMRAAEDFLQKMDILKLAFQAEFLDGDNGRELAAGVISRGGDGSKMTLEDFEALIDEYGARTACRLDNSRVPAAQRIDCSDAAARAHRPLVTGNAG